MHSDELGSWKCKSQSRKCKAWSFPVKRRNSEQSIENISEDNQVEQVEEEKFEQNGDESSKGDEVSSTLSDNWISSEIKQQWLSQTSISAESYQYVDFIVGRESSWNPKAVNPSSGSCSLAQALPCSKIGDDWENPIVALNWMDSYVNQRYGSWESAYNFWNSNHWY